MLYPICRARSQLAASHLILDGKRETTTDFPALLHAIWRLSAITACSHCFAAAVVSISSSGPEIF
jgi:hypothetical protein